MIASMTGFTSRTVILDNGKGSQIPCTISIRSLNGRFLEVSCKVPSFLASLEVEFLKLCKEHLKRGTITLLIQTPSKLLMGNEVHAHSALIKSYLHTAKKVQQEESIGGTITINDLLAIDGLFTIEETDLFDTIRTKLVLTLTELLQEIHQVRLQEGVALQQDLAGRLVHIKKSTTIIKQEAERVLQERKKTITAKIHALEQTSPDLVTLHRASLYLELDKADLHEELVRFDSHIAAFEQLLADSMAEKGRRLDFIVQELNREINTIASKCNDSTISQQAINIKVELEKAREQVQNIV
ncbi:MAG: YicC/YloC family endoribonuclease [Candidatus Babeliales bacterium]